MNRGGRPVAGAENVPDLSRLNLESFVSFPDASYSEQQVAGLFGIWEPKARQRFILGAIRDGFLRPMKGRGRVWRFERRQVELLVLDRLRGGLREFVARLMASRTDRVTLPVEFLEAFGRECAERGWPGEFESALREFCLPPAPNRLDPPEVAAGGER